MNQINETNDLNYANHLGQIDQNPRNWGNSGNSGGECVDNMYLSLIISRWSMKINEWMGPSSPKLVAFHERFIL